MLIFFLFCGCKNATEAPVHVVNNKSYGVIDGVFRNRFWHYYERGVSYAEGRFFQEALADFDKAIALRPEDQRRARTYGMHFIDYFPNREKGIVLLEMERPEDAKQNLEKSLIQFPSAKAAFYIDRIREKLLKNNNIVNRDKSTPSSPLIELRVTPAVAGNGMATDEIWTKEDPVILNGEINDVHYVSELLINSDEIFLGHASEHVSLNHPLTLEQGHHELHVHAKNLMGLESDKAIVIHVDREGPVIVIESMTRNPKENEILVSALLCDEAGIAGLTVKRDDGSDQTIPYQDLPYNGHALMGTTKNKSLNKTGHDRDFHIKGINSEAGADSYRLDRYIQIKLHDSTGHIVIKAFDRLDNETVARVSVTPRKINSKTENRSLSKTKAVLVADAGVFINTGVLADSGGLTGSGSSMAGLVKEFFQSASEDKSPPVLSIPDWEEPQSVYLDKVYLDGEALDDQSIKSITVEGVEKFRQPTDKQSAISHLFFNHMLRLKPGENRITVSATDEQGNTSTRVLTITRVVAEAFQLKNRLSLLVLPFENRGEVPESASGFQDNVLGNLVEQNRFNMIERAKLDAILEEQKLSSEAIFDQTNAIQIGKLLSARSILTGTILATRNGLEIATRMVDTETSEIIAAKDVYGESMELPAIRDLAQGLAVKLHLEFPLVSGMVVQNKDDALIVDLGQGVLKLNRRVIVFREEPVVHPVTGKTLGSDNTILGYAKVNQVMEDISRVTIISSGTSAKALDKIITE
ncbi:MAG: hypothetical protein HQK61_05820 [Desulfamplus sp.]|nr:hypothetical protein [Desulfamplus sp.]